MASLRGCDNLYYYNNTYYKAYFIKVKDIILIDPILSNSIIYELKLALNNFYILILSSLVVILAIKACFEL